jgi:hypothetical protein
VNACETILPFPNFSGAGFGSLAGGGVSLFEGVEELAALDLPNRARAAITSFYSLTIGILLWLDFLMKRL